MEASSLAAREGYHPNDGFSCVCEVGPKVVFKKDWKVVLHVAVEQVPTPHLVLLLITG